jgi:hypothetical protein
MARENRDWGYDRIAGALANLQGLRSNGRQRPATSWPAAGTRTQAHDTLVGIHPDPPGAAGRDRLLHHGGAHAARAGDLLRVVFHPSREPDDRGGMGKILVDISGRGRATAVGNVPSRAISLSRLETER